jgi:hypothetical protein
MVSFIIPTYYQETRIGTTLEDLGGMRGDVEVIVVDLAAFRPTAPQHGQSPLSRL